MGYSEFLDWLDESLSSLEEAIDQIDQRVNVGCDIPLKDFRRLLECRSKISDAKDLVFPA